ncbi:MAG: KipI antagonist, partial [Pyrinomonadaceae bacterium]|nr:KipI antagonist [Pyrinomonadaceae bacterium]
IKRNSDRMGFRLEGKPLSRLNDFEIVSTSVSFGTIQLLPTGQLVVLMVDHQTSGGYPKIGHIIGQDLPIIGQLGAGDRVRFELVSVKEAEDLTLKFEKDLRFLKMGLRFKSNK